MTHPDPVLCRRLAALVARTPVVSAPEDAQAVDYDWFAPQRFRGAQLEALRELAGRMASTVAERLSAALRAEHSASGAEVTEHYAAEVRTEVARMQQCLILLLTSAKDICGAALIPCDRAAAWVARMLGASDAKCTDRALSALETALFHDAASVVVAAVSQCIEAVACPALRPDAAVHRIAPALPGDETTDYVRIVLRLSRDETPFPVTLFLRSTLLSGVGGGHRGPGATGDARAAITAHLERVCLPVRVELGSADVPMRDLAALEAGDVLVLTPPPQGSVLRVCGKPLFAGQPVRCEEQYGFRVIACLRAGAAAPANPAPAAPPRPPAAPPLPAPPTRALKTQGARNA